MEGLVQGILGGIVPAVLMLIIFFVSLAGRLAKIETNIKWLKKVMEECLPRLKDRSP